MRLLMNIEEMKNHEWVISWSGGKDSTATIILCHEYGIPIKKIIYVRMMYNNTIPATLPIMTQFVDKAKQVFERWGYEVEIVKSQKTAEDLIQKKYVRSKKPNRNGQSYGITAFARGHCFFTSIKTRTIQNILNDNDFQMIGYAADEEERLHRLTSKKQSIMAALGVKENDAYSICKKYSLLSPYYNLGFYRDGCWFCPNANNYQRDYLKYNHPELVDEIYKTIKMCDYDLQSVQNRNNWIKDYFSKQQYNQMDIYDFTQ